MWLGHWATIAGQPPALTILYIYCTGSTEGLSRTPGSHSVCAIRTPSGKNPCWVVLSLQILRASCLMLEINERNSDGTYWVAARHILSGCQVWSNYFHTTADTMCAIGLGSLTLGVHAQRGLQYLVCVFVCVSVCLSVCLLLNISLFTCLFVPQTILTFSAADESRKF